MAQAEYEGTGLGEQAEEQAYELSNRMQGLHMAEGPSEAGGDPLSIKLGTSAGQMEEEKGAIGEAGGGGG